MILGWLKKLFLLGIVALRSQCGKVHALMKVKLRSVRCAILRKLQVHFHQADK